jgi:hypothetical protein
MSLVRVLRLECDVEGCDNEFQGVAYRQGDRKQPAQDTRRLAAHQGWERLAPCEENVHGYDICPEHSSKRASGVRLVFAA